MEDDLELDADLVATSLAKLQSYAAEPCPALKEVKLNDTVFSIQDIQEFSELIKKSTHLSTINLNNCSIQDDSIDNINLSWSLLLSAISNNKNVKNLCLNNIELPTIALYALAKAKNKNGLINLDLSGSHLTIEHGFIIQTILLCSDTLEELNIDNCQITAQTAKVIADGVELSTSLTSLSWYDNQLLLDSLGFVPFLRATAHNPKIKEFHIPNASFNAENNDVAHTMISYWFDKAQHLEYLSLGSLYLNDYLSSIKNISQLKKINLSRTNCQDIDLPQYAKDIAQLIAQAPMLEKINLSGLYFAPEDFALLIQAGYNSKTINNIVFEEDIFNSEAIISLLPESPSFEIELTHNSIEMHKNILANKQFDLICVGTAHPDNIFTFNQQPIINHTGAASSQKLMGGVGYNMAVILKNLGNRVAITPVLGNDSNAEYVLNSIREQNIDCSNVIRSEYNTASYTAFHGPDGEMFAAAIEIEIYNKLTTKMLKPITQNILQVENWVLDSNFAREAYAYLALLARNHNIKLFLTISSIYESEKIIPLLPQATSLFGNAEEMRFLAAKLTHTEYAKSEQLSAEQIWSALETIAATGIKNIFATDGANGVYVLSDQQRLQQKAIPVEKIISVNGAGDTFAATAIDSMIRNQPLADTIDAAICAAFLRITGQEVNNKNIIKAQGAHLKFTPLSLRPEVLTQSDLLLPIKKLNFYVESQNFPIQDIDQIEQLSPIGLALIADHYNRKGDQLCDIKVATENNELIAAIQAVNAAPNGTKQVVIFQPTSGCEPDTFFHSIHKTVIYLEKRYGELRILHADSVHFKPMEEYIELIAKKALGDITYHLLLRDPIEHPEDKSWLHLQVSYTQCGTHAMRLARKIAKCKDLLGSLEYTDSLSRNNNMFIRRYTIPAIFGVSAESSLMRKEILSLYNKTIEGEKLTAHYAKYADKGSYGWKFSQKYVELAKTLVEQTPQEDLAKAVTRSSVLELKL